MFYVGASCGYVGASWGYVGARLGHLGAMLGHLDSILDHVGVMLQPSWCQEASYKQKLEILMNFTSQGGVRPMAWDGRWGHGFFHFSFKSVIRIAVLASGVPVAPIEYSILEYSVRNPNGV